MAAFEEKKFHGRYSDPLLESCPFAAEKVLKSPLLLH